MSRAPLREQLQESADAAAEQIVFRDGSTLRRAENALLRGVAAGRTPFESDGCLRCLRGLPNVGPKTLLGILHLVKQRRGPTLRKEPCALWGLGSPNFCDYASRTKK